MSEPITGTPGASATSERAEDMQVLTDISEKLGAVAARVDEGFKSLSERQSALETGLKETNDRVVEVRVAMATMCSGGSGSHSKDSTKPAKSQDLDAAADRQILQKQQLLFKQMLTLIGLLVAAIGVLVAVLK
jgi:hypothetical protein